MKAGFSPNHPSRHPSQSKPIQANPSDPTKKMCAKPRKQRQAIRNELQPPKSPRGIAATQRLISRKRTQRSQRKNSISSYPCVLCVPLWQRNLLELHDSSLHYCDAKWQRRPGSFLRVLRLFAANQSK
jgi:hypothetical protein